MNKPNQNKKGGGKGGNKGPQVATMEDIKASAFKGLTPKSAKRYIHAVGALQYGPQARQLRAEQRASKLAAYRDKIYFKQYNRSIKPLQKQTKKAYNQAAGGIAKDSAALGDYAAKLQGQLASEGQTSAALRGVGYTPDATGAQAAIARYKTGNTLGGVVRAQGASQRAYLTDQKRIGKREKIDALQQEANRGRSYNQDLENLARERGAAAAQAKQQLIDSNRQFYLGLRSSKTAAKGAQTSRINARTSQANAATSAKNAATSALNAQTSIARLRHDVHTGKISHKEFKQQEARLRRQARYDRRHPSSSSSSGAVDKTHVGHMLGLLNGLTGKNKQIALKNPAKAKQDLLGESVTFTNKEANIAYRRWRKGQGGGRSNVSQATGGHRPS